MTPPLRVWLLYHWDLFCNRPCWRPRGVPHTWLTYNAAIEQTQPGWAYAGCDIEYKHQPALKPHEPREFILWEAPDAAQ